MTDGRWPEGDKVHLARVNIPQSLLAREFVEEPTSAGVTLVDLLIEDGRISAIRPPGSPSSWPRFDADGGQAWLPFADLHTHLDKGQIWPRAGNNEGTLEIARAAGRADTIAHWRAEDVEARFEFSLRCAYAHGTTAIRTHIDCFVPGQAAISFGVFRRLRDRWAGRMTLQANALVGTELYDAPDHAAIVDIVAESEARLGGITFRLSEEEDPSILDGRLNRLFALAASRGLDVDLHVDENGSPASTTLAQVALAVLRSGFRGQVVCGHCCALSVVSDEVAQHTIRLVREAGLKIVSLPLVNQYLQGRKGGGTPMWRGVTLLRELHAEGVDVALASDNCRDPYHPFGDLDLLEVYGAGIKIGQLDGAMSEWAPAVTSVPAAIICAKPGLFRPGVAADFQVFRGRSFSELLARRQADRLVIRNGRPVDTTLPDFRTLDHLMHPTG